MKGLNLTRATTGPPDIKHTCTQTILAMVFYSCYRVMGPESYHMSHMMATCTDRRTKMDQNDRKHNP